jgi:hypothetical protein
MTMQCKQCSRPFLKEERVASISGSILGDECTDSYFLCPVCGVYTVAGWCDVFTGGEETLNLSGPLSKEEGDKRIEQIQRCSRPWDKKCRCDAHRAYFHNTLD